MRGASRIVLAALGALYSRKIIDLAIAVTALASTVAVAEPGVVVLKPGFYVDKRTGCRILSVRYRPGATMQWSGACKDGLADGSGVATITHVNPGSAVVEVRIEGTYVDGTLNGRALVTFSDGSRFEGEMNRGHPVGKARLVLVGIGHKDVEYSPGGSLVEYGVFQYDPNCRCDTPGGRYAGEMPLGKRQGKGILTMPNGDRYEGEWMNGLPHGAGTLTQNGKSYVGTWFRGCSDTDGTMHKFLVTTCQP